MKLKLGEIVKVCSAKVIKSVDLEIEFGFSTDTRTIKSDELYIPLKGENFDGENFIEKAIESGAIGYFTSDKNKIFTNADVILLVNDTKEAYLKLANYYKNKIKPYTIAITGSSGKTTVKEMMYCVFKNASNQAEDCEQMLDMTVKSVLNHNNEIGLCQTLFSITPNTKYLIVEMGMRGLGEIELLSKYAEPDIGVIVNTGSAHIGRLGSLLNIAKAKFEITKYLNKNGVLIAHNNPLIKQINDNKHKTIYFDLNDSELTIEEMTSNYSIFNYKGNKYRVNSGGEHNIQNALSVIEAGLFAGLKPDIIAKGLAEFTPIEKRWDVQEVKGFKIINDSYNSNPESVKAALKTFLSFTPFPKTIVLGDMGELGLNEEEYHINTGKFLEGFEFDYLLTIGELAKFIQPNNKKVVHFETKKELVDFIKNKLPKESNILLKASRFMKFEEIIEELKI